MRHKHYFWCLSGGWRFCGAHYLVVGVYDCRGGYIGSGNLGECLLSALREGVHGWRLLVLR